MQGEHTADSTATDGATHEWIPAEAHRREDEQTRAEIPVQEVHTADSTATDGVTHEWIPAEVHRREDEQTRAEIPVQGEHTADSNVTDGAIPATVIRTDQASEDKPHAMRERKIT